MTVAEAIKARDEYVAAYKKEKATYDAQAAEYRTAVLEWRSEILENVKRVINCDDITVAINSAWGAACGIRISNEHRFHDKTVALKWSMDIRINGDRTVEMTSNSWPGADITTMDAVNDLANTVELLKSIHSVDWAAVVTRNQPEFRDYITSYLSFDETCKYDDMVEEAKLEETITERKIIKVNRRCYVDYISIIKATDKQYRYTAYTVSKEVEDNSKMYDMLHEGNFTKNAARMSKENLRDLIGSEYEIVEC